MAFGFGFNKAKVLASAEKHVQQGKLNQAISEYEKIVEKDPKDLTVLNTIGDLYARIGQNEKAGEFFKRVGDTYAAEGFTVKAIAMYKKLTKLNAGATAVVQRLAEFYTQQGLYNDARQQYLVLADSYVKSNDLGGAARVFQKMLDMDPDNVSLQSKLADLLVKTGRKTEARDIFLRAATSLYQRGSVQQADEALNRMLALDPANMEALVMRGKIALDAGDGASAVRFLEKIPDIDSRADGLQSLLKAHILNNDAEQAEGIARKLASVHNDLTGVREFADYLIAKGKSDAALKVYDEYMDRLAVSDTGTITLALQGLSGQVKDDPAALEKLRTLFQKVGATANIPEVNELLAHASVQAGDLAKARDLYKELADLEPSNPQHMQNYRQVLARMGEEPMARQLDEGEAAQALFVEEIEDAPLPPSPEYPAALAEKIANVLTDAELFESYNKPEQALAPLEAMLKQAPQDVRLNQRLLAVYGRTGKLAEAAKCCDTLAKAYRDAAMDTDAQRYVEMGARFRGAAGVPEGATPTAEKMRPFIAEAAPPVARTEEITAEAFKQAASVPTSAMPTLPVDGGEAHEIDLSSEWDAVEIEDEAAIPVESAPPEPAIAEFDVAPPEVHPSVVSDLLEEIKFYISQQMWDEARSALARCEQLAPDTWELGDLKLLLEKGSATVSVGPVEEVAVEVEDVEPESPPVSAEEPVAGEATVADFNFESEAAEVSPASSGSPVPSFEVAPAPEPEVEVAVAETRPVELAVEDIPAESEPEVEVAEAEEEEPELAEQPALVAAHEPEPIAAAPREKDHLRDLVLDLEETLGDDFGKPAVAAAVAAATGPVTPMAPQIAASISTSTNVAVAAAPEVAVVAAPSLQEDTSSVLSDLFAEFKEEVGEAKEEAEDPETHYNLGVAFKEMGLLDEAIGELQKVCKAIDRGTQFSQVMQAYTWLANCFVEKGVPEAGIKWYEKALGIPSAEESQTALHYDLACAYEAAGDRHLALKHFTEVYGTNIDYRDVAERIKALKS